MRHITLSLLIVLTASVTLSDAKSQPSPGQAATPATIAVRLSNFAFTPDHVRLRVGVPVHFQLVNESSGGHDFSAPAFFAASNFAPGSPRPPAGKVDVPSQTMVELTLTPSTPGTYPVECTHFLHALFGMSGTIEVVGPAG